MKMNSVLGIGFRQPLFQWLLSKPNYVGNLELTAEHFFDGGDDVLAKLAGQYDTFVHGLGLSLGTPGPLCQQTLDQFARVADSADAKWISEHVAFSRTQDVDLGHLNPVPRTEESLQTLVAHAIEVRERCNRPLILENITSSLDVGGAIEETDFLNRLCEQADCGLLLDVTNLFINSKNHGYDPVGWLKRLDASKIIQLHVVGYNLVDGVYHDHHCNPIQDDLMKLIQSVLEFADVQAVTLERDDRLDNTEEIESELARLQRSLDLYSATS